MLWTEETSPTPFQVSDDVLECIFSIRCRTLPVDHAHALSLALQKELPWLANEPAAGIHQIHIPESGNGWQRPNAGENQVLYLSRRTRLKLRLPKTCINAAQKLSGRTLDIEGHPLTIGAAKTQLLRALDTLIARHVVATQEELDNEALFTQRVVERLNEMGIQVRKLLNGKPHHLHTSDTPVHTRSVMLADLSPTESILLQQQGLRPNRLLGCGLFIPHKGIRAVAESQSKPGDY